MKLIMTTIEDRLSAQSSNAEIQLVYNELYADQQKLKAAIDRQLSPAHYREVMSLHDAVAAGMRVMANVTLAQRSTKRA